MLHRKQCRLSLYENGCLLWRQLLAEFAQCSQAQAQLASDNQPTVLDVHRPPQEQPQALNGKARWLLRYRDAAGKLHRYRGTTEQVTR